MKCNFNATDFLPLLTLRYTFLLITFLNQRQLIEKNTQDRLRNKIQKSNVELKTDGEFKYMGIHIKIHTHRDYLYVYNYISLYTLQICKYVLYEYKMI